MLANPNALVMAPSSSQNKSRNVIADGKCATLVLNDGGIFAAPCAFTAEKATVQRTVGAESYATLALPFAVSASQAGGKLYTFSSEDDGEESVTLNFSSAEAIEANQPALLLSTTAQDALVFEGVSVVPAEAGIAGGTAFDFVGNYDGTISTMKKTYLSPSLSSTEMLAAQIIASSIKIEGDASIPFGGDDTEGISGEVKGSTFDENPFE